ncbi:MAG: diaminopimelate decarboxylase [Bryobacterales bacterium]|nr:diaminopimelate decarboxylase [Bryobacterales bacterium]
MLSYQDRSLYADSVPLADIARKVGTPAYVYSAATIRANYRAYADALDGVPHQICFAVKANSNLAVLRLLAREGSGFDIVSGGELHRVLAAGGDPARTVYSGVGKTADEIDMAIANGIQSFNCESEAELGLIEAIAARHSKRVAFSLRVNPDVDAATHPYISTGLREHKFGIDIGEARDVYRRAAALPHLEAAGVSCHIGSQILDPTPLMEALDKVLDLARHLAADGLPIRHIDLGGGLGVAYRPEDPAPAISAYGQRLRERFAGAGFELILEPGRSIVAPAGVLLTRVLYRKRSYGKEFMVVDAAMNDLIRPSLYQSHHEIIPLRRSDRGTVVADVVGPVCESGDFLARGREMDNAAPGDLLAVCTAGAYGFVLASNYNARPRPAEVLVEDDRWRIVRERETYAGLMRGEEP